MKNYLEKIALNYKQIAGIGAVVGGAVPFVLSHSHKNHILNKVQYNYHGYPSKVTDSDVNQIKPVSAFTTAGLGTAIASAIKPARDYLQGERTVLNSNNKYLRAAAAGLGVAGVAQLVRHEQLSRLADKTKGQ